MNTRQKLANYFRAGYAGLFVTSYEEARVTAELVAVANDIDYELWTWSVTDSLMGPIGKKDEKGEPLPVQTILDNEGQPLSPIGVLDMMVEKQGKPCLPMKTIILAKDYQLFTGDPNPVLIRKIKDALESGRQTARRFVILGCQFKLTPELEKEFTPVEFGLPDREALGEIAKQIGGDAGIPLNGNMDSIKDAACGMTTTEAADAFALAVIESNKTEIAPAVVSREKCGAVTKSGLLKILEPKETMSDVGGNGGAKNWIIKRAKAFSKEAQVFGLPTPKGVLLTGIAGTGKTLICKAASSVMKVPLIQLDGGKIFGSLVGESERNLRSVIATAEAVAPCILFVDELEKAFSGSKSSGMTDGGTSARVFGTFLSWLNDKTSPVFVVASANDISGLPPEFLRKGRFDEIFFVDLPDNDERAEIFKIHIAKRKRDPGNFCLDELSQITQGFTGSEIEAVVVEGLYKAFEQGHDLNMEDMEEAIRETIPLSRTMAQEVEALRTWAQGRARKASLPKAETREPKNRKLT